MQGIQLRVLTLNAWGVFVPFACKKRNERIHEIGKELGKGAYDIVFLQEIWSNSDYEKLCLALCTSMPHTHYFHGGIIGSGLCVFSKHRIAETSQFRFSLNGYAHRIGCSDWMGAKSVGLAKIILEPSGLRVNAYTTHLHAQYSCDGSYNSYDDHRCLQSFEAAKFVRDTSSSCDVVIFGGDFNIMPHQIGYKLVRVIGNLEDSWRVQIDPLRAKYEEPTCERPDNLIGPVGTHCQEGVRIDYLFHRANPGTSVKCELCDLAMRKIPGFDFSYSDHEGVEAIYSIKKDSEEMGLMLSGQTPVDMELGGYDHLEQAVCVLKDGEKRVRRERKLWLIFSAFIACLLVFIIAYQHQNLQQLSAMVNNVEKIHVGQTGGRLNKESMTGENPSIAQNSCLMFYITEILKILLSALSLFSLTHGLIILTIELVTIRASVTDMKNMSRLSLLPK